MGIYGEPYEEPLFDLYALVILNDIIMVIFFVMLSLEKNQLSGRQDSKYYSKQLSLTESVLSLVLSIYIQQVLPNYHWHHYVDSHHKIFLIFIIYFDYF